MAKKKPAQMTGFGDEIIYAFTQTLRTVTDHGLSFRTSQKQDLSANPQRTALSCLALDLRALVHGTFKKILKFIERVSLALLFGEYPSEFVSDFSH